MKWPVKGGQGGHKCKRAIKPEIDNLNIHQNVILARGTLHSENNTISMGCKDWLHDIKLWLIEYIGHGIKLLCIKTNL